MNLDVRQFSPHPETPLGKLLFRMDSSGGYAEGGRARLGLVGDPTGSSLSKSVDPPARDSEEFQGRTPFMRRRLRSRLGVLSEQFHESLAKRMSECTDLATRKPLGTLGAMDAAFLRGLDESSPDIENFGTDALGWYVPFHYSWHSEWGIFIDMPGVARIAQSSRFAMLECGSFAFLSLLAKVFYHEWHHHEEELILSEIEMLRGGEVAMSVYRKYDPKVSLTEALCNAAALAEMEHLLTEMAIPALARMTTCAALVDFCRSQSQQYSNFYLYPGHHRLRGRAERQGFRREQLPYWEGLTRWLEVNVGLCREVNYNSAWYRRCLETLKGYNQAREWTNVPVYLCDPTMEAAQLLG